MKRIILAICALVFAATAGHASISDVQKSGAAIILKLLPSQPADGKTMILSIALSFTNPSGKPVFEGVRILSGPLSFDGRKSIFGFRNGDGVTHFKHPTHGLIIGDGTYNYAEADADRQENGTLSLYPRRSDPVSYLLKGAFYAQGHLFMINEIVHVNEEKIIYSQESKQPLQLTIRSGKQLYKAGEEISIRVEFKNVSLEPITLLDFQDKPREWQAPASYFRCMVLGINQEPIPYQLIHADIVKYITIAPGEVYSFDQNYNDSIPLTAKPQMDKLKVIYDTRIFAEGVWKEDYWKGRLESNEVPITVEIKN